MSKENLPANVAESGLRQSTGGVFENVDRLAAAIKKLGETYNLIVPGGAVGTKFPPLHAVGVSFVFIDPEKETYKIPGRSDRGIGKTALDRISAAAGVRWNPHLCGRVDDGSDPNFIEYQVAGSVLQLDGTERMISASKRIDLRADPNTGSSSWGADAQEIARQAAKADPPREPWPQILQARQHIFSLAETKAKNRAIRSLGVRTAYSPEEIAKGFAVARLQFTGHSDDPEVEREVSIMIAQRALQSGGMLYGQRQERILPARTVPRVVDVKAKDDEADDKNGNCPDPGGATEEQKSVKPNPLPTSKAPENDPKVICGPQDKEGNWPRKPCSLLSVSELRNKISAYEKKQPTWDPKWAGKNQAELNAMKAWLAFRELDPRQGTLDTDKAAASDVVPF